MGERIERSNAVLIAGNGNFNRNVEQNLQLMPEKNSPFAIVSAIGAQNIGKSTVLNKIFDTHFPERNVAQQGLGQATNGVCIAKSSFERPERKILVLDTEGSDGCERARQGDTAFEKKIALFAVAMSNIVILNVRHENVNRHEAGSWPLLEIVFEVWVRMLETEGQRIGTEWERNLLFLLRDKIPGSDFHMAEEQLLRKLNETWQGMWSSQSRPIAALQDYFKITVRALPNYLYERQAFENEVDNLRTQIANMINNIDRPIPASTFVSMAEKTWNDIKDDKILNLQVTRRDIHEICCHRIAEEKLQGISENEDWHKIKTEVLEQGKDVEGFGKDVSSVIEKYRCEYDDETKIFDEEQRNKSRNYLTSELLKMPKSNKQTGIMLIHN